MTIDEMIEVLQAAKRGESIQRHNKYLAVTYWEDCVDVLTENLNIYDLRIKPKPREFFLWRDQNGMWSVEEVSGRRPCGEHIWVREVLDDG